jgi:hypothetical protein
MIEFSHLSVTKAPIRYNCGRALIVNENFERTSFTMGSRYRII